MQRVAQIERNPRARFWYLPVPGHVRERLAGIGRELAGQAGGAPDDADHVTLCFVPKADDALDDDEVSAALDAVADAVAGFDAFQVWVGGIAYFDTAVKDRRPATAVVALIDGPGLDRLHLAVADALRGRGWDWKDTHTFTAHCTLAYLPVGARAVDLPVIDRSWATWTVGGVGFANAEVHHVPFGDQPSGSRQAGRLPMLSSRPIVAASMCRRAELHGEALRRFRTQPDTGRGALYDYCSECVHLERVPPRAGDPAAPGQSQLYGCNAGDDPDVAAYSEQITTGEIEPEPGDKACPGFIERETADAVGSETIRQAARRGDVTADMFKDVPGEVSFFDEGQAARDADDPVIDPLQGDEGIEPEAPEPEHRIDPDRYIWRAHVYEDPKRGRFNHHLRDGRVFEWDDPPFDGHPGTLPACRCWAEGIVLSSACPRCGRRPDDEILADLFR